MVSSFFLEILTTKKVLINQLQSGLLKENCDRIVADSLAAIVSKNGYIDARFRVQTKLKSQSSEGLEKK